MARDLGFELPDVRERYIDTQGRLIEIAIVRDWRHKTAAEMGYGPGDEVFEEPETTFDVSFTITARDNYGEGSPVVLAAVNGSETTAQKIAHTLARVSQAKSRSLWETDQIEAMERRAEAHMEARYAGVGYDDL